MQFMDRMVNNNQLTWMLRTCRICNSNVGFSKYEFYNKLLGGDHGILLRITLGVTWTQLIIYLNYSYLIE